jgi:hypothetical protein
MFGKRKKQKPTDKVLTRRFQGRAEIDSDRFEKAKDDPEVEAFVRDARHEGKRLRRKGMIHP